MGKDLIPMKVLNPKLLARKTEIEQQDINPLDEEFTISEESPLRKEEPISVL